MTRLEGWLLEHVTVRSWCFISASLVALIVGAATIGYRVGRAPQPTAIAGATATETSDGVRELVKQIQDFEAALAASGQMADATHVREELEQLGMSRIGQMEVSPSNVFTAFDEISMHVGAGVTAEEKVRATRAAMKGMAAHLNLKSATDMGSNFAYLMQERRGSGAFGDYDDNKLSDLAYQVTVAIGGALSDRQLAFLIRTHDKLLALKLIEGAAISHQGMDVVEDLERTANHPLNTDAH